MFQQPWGAPLPQPPDTSCDNLLNNTRVISSLYWQRRSEVEWGLECPLLVQSEAFKLIFYIRGEENEKNIF